MADEQTKALKAWKEEARRLIRKAEEEGRELTSEEKKYLREKKKTILNEEKELRRSQRIEQKEKKKKKKEESRRLLTKYKEDYKTKKARIADQWKKELAEAKEMAKKEGRSLSKLEKKALRDRKKELFAQIEEEYTSQRVSLKLEMKKEKESERLEKKSRRMEAQKEKKRKKLQEIYEYEKLEDQYLEKWQIEISRIHQKAEGEGRDLTGAEKKQLIHLRKKYMKDCKEEWRSQRLETQKTEKEKKRKAREEERKIRERLGESAYSPQQIGMVAGGALVALILAFFFFQSTPKVAQKDKIPLEGKEEKNLSSKDNKDKTPGPQVRVIEKKDTYLWPLLDQAKSKEKSEQYGGALALLNRVLREAQDSNLLEKARQQKTWIEGMVKEEFEDVLVEARGKAELGNFVGAKKALLRIIQKWKLEPYLSRAQKLFKEISSRKPVVKIVLPPLPKKMLLDLEALEKKFQFKKALALWEQMAKTYSLPPLLKKFRFFELQAQKNLVDRFIGMAGEGSLLYPLLSLPTSEEGKVVSADREMVFVKFAGSQIGLDYPSIDPTRVIRLFQWKETTALDYLYLGVLTYRLGVVPPAHSFWIRSLRKDPSLQKKIFGYLSYKKGIAPPLDGYIIYQHQLLTAEEKVVVLQKESIEGQIKVLFAGRGKKEDKDKALAALKELPAKLKAFAAELLQKEQEKFLKNYRKKIQKFRKIKALKQELNRRRKEALRRIFDEERYYKKKTKDVVGQDWVDEAVARVAELWKNPFKALTSLSPSFKQLAAKLHLLSTLIRQLGGKTELDAETEMILQQATSRLSLQRVTLNDREARLLRYNLQVLQYNKKMASQIGPHEAREIAITNEYRMMMGLHALKIDTALARAARKHSQEMKELGYFEHTSPKAHLATPSKRVKLEGYTKGLVGENIYMGSSSPAAAHKGWYNSPPHHRNILYGDYEDLGVGNFQDHWTQNFGGSGKFKLP